MLGKEGLHICPPLHGRIPSSARRETVMKPGPENGREILPMRDGIGLMKPSITAFSGPLGRIGKPGTPGFLSKGKEERREGRRTAARL